MSTATLPTLSRCNETAAHCDDSPSLFLYHAARAMVVYNSLDHYWSKIEQCPDISESTKSAYTKIQVEIQAIVQKSSCPGRDNSDKPNYLNVLQKALLNILNDVDLHTSSEPYALFNEVFEYLKKFARYDTAFENLECFYQSPAVPPCDDLSIIVKDARYFTLVIYALAKNCDEFRYILQSKVTPDFFKVETGSQANQYYGWMKLVAEKQINEGVPVEKRAVPYILNFRHAVNCVSLPHLLRAISNAMSEYSSTVDSETGMLKLNQHNTPKFWNDLRPGLLDWVMKEMCTDPSEDPMQVLRRLLSNSRTRSESVCSTPPDIGTQNCSLLPTFHRRNTKIFNVCRKGKLCDYPVERLWTVRERYVQKLSCKELTHVIKEALRKAGAPELFVTRTSFYTRRAHHKDSKSDMRLMNILFPESYAKFEVTLKAVFSGEWSDPQVSAEAVTIKNLTAMVKDDTSADDGATSDYCSDESNPASPVDTPVKPNGGIDPNDLCDAIGISGR